MDLVVLSARLFARPTIAALGVEGRTPEKRREQLLREITGYATEDDLVGRHIARSALWGIMLALTAPVLIAAAVAVSLVVGGDGFTLLWALVFLQLSMAGR